MTKRTRENVILFLLGAMVAASAGSFKNPHLWRGLFGITALGFSIWAFIDYVKSGEKNFGGKILFLIFLTVIVVHSFLAFFGIIPDVCPINSIRDKL